IESRYEGFVDAGGVLRQGGANLSRQVNESFRQTARNNHALMVARKGREVDQLCRISAACSQSNRAIRILTFQMWHLNRSSACSLSWVLPTGSPHLTAIGKESPVCN